MIARTESRHSRNSETRVVSAPPDHPKDREDNAVHPGGLRLVELATSSRHRLEVPRQPMPARSRKLNESQSPWMDRIIFSILGVVWRRGNYTRLGIPRMSRFRARDHPSLHELDVH